MLKSFNLINTLKSKHAIYYLIIFVFTFLLYKSTINNSYCFDDEFVVYNNELVHKGIKAIPEIFTQSYSTMGGQIFGYRPIVKSLFAIEYSLFGENPLISHLINILIYCITCMLLFKILSRIFSTSNVFLPFVIVLLFIAHPIHTEVVASLKNREELLCFLFGLFSLNYFILYSQKQKIHQLLFGGLFFILSYLSKETALIFILIIPLTLLLFTKFKPRYIIIVLLSLFLVFRLIFKAINAYIPSDNTPLFFENPLHLINDFNHVIGTGFYSLFLYLKLLIYPHPLSFYYGYNMVPLMKSYQLIPIISLILHISILIFAVISYKKRPIISYGIIIYLVSIGLFSNILFPINGIIGERLAYGASLGFLIVLGYGFYYLWDKLKLKTLSIVILIILLIPYSAKTIIRTKDWKNHLTLYEHDIDHLTHSAKANDLYASALYNIVLYKGLYEMKTPQQQIVLIDKTVKYYNQSLSIYYENPVIHNSLGTIYLNLVNDLSLAKKHLHTATVLDSSFEKAYFNLGEVYKKSNDMDSALINYKKAVSLDSDYFDALSELSKVENRLGNFEEAVLINEKLILLDTLSEIPYINLGNFYFLRSDTLTGLKYAEKAVILNPGNFILLEAIGNLYLSLKNQEKSDYYLRKAQLAKSTFNQKIKSKRP